MLQAQALIAELPPDEVVSVGHETHALAPATDEYVPAVQLIHALAPAPAAYDPALQFAHAVAVAGILLYLIMTMPEPPFPPFILSP
jgi:hypothetical protein